MQSTTKNHKYERSSTAGWKIRRVLVAIRILSCEMISTECIFNTILLA